MSGSKDKKIKVWKLDASNEYKCIYTKREAGRVFDLIILDEDNKKAKEAQQDLNERIELIKDDFNKQPEEVSFFPRFNIGNSLVASKGLLSL